MVAGAKGIPPFSLNCVYGPKGRVRRILGGSLGEAFAAAVAACRESIGHRFEEPVDVTIASAYPHTHGHQLFKGLSAPDAVTKPSGAILLLAPAAVPVHRDFLASLQEVERLSGGDPADYVRKFLSEGKAFLPEKPIDFNMAMSTVFLRPRIRTMLVSPGISRPEADIMGFRYALSIEEGVRSLAMDYPDARVAILPCGGLIEPICVWEEER